MTTSPTLADLRVIVDSVFSRDATREDLLAVLGGVEVWWCEMRGTAGQDECSGHALCGKHLIIPIEKREPSFVEGERMIT